MRETPCPVGGQGVEVRRAVASRGAVHRGRALKGIVGHGEVNREYGWVEV